MSYPPVVQFETRVIEAEALARLAVEKRPAERMRPHSTHKRPRLVGRLLGRPAERAFC
jgi:hypothetical protein